MLLEKSGADNLLTQRIHRGVVAIHLAAHRGVVDIMEELLDHGADIRALTLGEGWSVLHVAAAQNNLDALAYGIQMGVDVGLLERRGKTCLDVSRAIAAQLGDECSILLTNVVAGNASAVPYETFGPYYLRRAVEGNRSEEVKRLLDYGVNPRHVMWNPGSNAAASATASPASSSASTGTASSCGTCRTVLMDAAQRRLTPIVRLLTRFGADPNFGDAGGRTAVHYAAYGGDTASMEELLRRGGDVNRRTRAGVSVLDVALRAKNREMVELIRKRRDFVGDRGVGGAASVANDDAVKVDVVEGDSMIFQMPPVVSFQPKGSQTSLMSTKYFGESSVRRHEVVDEQLGIHAGELTQRTRRFVVLV